MHRDAALAPGIEARVADSGSQPIHGRLSGKHGGELPEHGRALGKRNLVQIEKARRVGGRIVAGMTPGGMREVEEIVARGNLAGVDQSEPTILNTIEAPFIYVDGNDNDNGAYDMTLMSQCRHFIISNSSFSWWPAWLAGNKDKIVICPDRWFTDDAPKSFKDGNKTAMNYPGWIALPAD